MDKFSPGYFREAVEKGHIRPYYQPIYRSVTGRILGAEALARWFDSDGRMISPAEFIPQLESSGLVYELDMEILRQTCAFYQELEKRGTPIHTFSVNLSRLDFKHHDIYDRVTSILTRYDVPHESIKLEITESLMLEEIDHFWLIFDRFHKAGFTIWIDDFGSGYSSLNVLQNYSFDLMKFDMLFLRNFTARGRKMLSSLINMAKSLGIHTLAEGVETKEQQEFLLSAGCEALQGFLFSKPLPMGEMIDLIDREGNEKPADKSYWNQIGYLNLLSPDPLEDAVQKDEDRNYEQFPGRGNAIALLECRRNRADYVYVSSSYLDRVHELGYRDIDELEEVFNNHRSDQYLMMKKLTTDAIEKGTVQTVEYINNDVYYRVFAKCLARDGEKAMLAMRLSTFESDREVKTASEMLDYGNTLFSTYKLVVAMYPESDISKRLYTSLNIPPYDHEGVTNMERLEQFCRNEVDPIDQERYLRFMNFADMAERVDADPNHYLQSLFRMRWAGEDSRWHTARITRIPSSGERIYLLTVQGIKGKWTKWLDSASPDKLE